jgi:hypothetical protein
MNSTILLAKVNFSKAGDDDIPMPDSPPPNAGNESEDDIELPEGPPPNRGTGAVILI